jgi:hypothetical protein
VQLAAEIENLWENLAAGLARNSEFGGVEEDTMENERMAAEKLRNQDLARANDERSTVKNELMRQTDEFTNAKDEYVREKDALIREREDFIKRKG